MALDWFENVMYSLLKDLIVFSNLQLNRTATIRATI